jgi:hypothetical protein
MTHHSPPLPLRRLLRLVTPPDLRAAIDGDLLEEFQREAEDRGHAQARWGYCRKVCRSIWPLLTFEARWSDVPRIVATTLLCVVLVGTFSHLLGLILESVVPGGPGATLTVSAHIGIVLLIAPAVGYGASWLARNGGILTCALAGAMMVAPAVVALPNPGAPHWVVLMWIAVLPPALLAGAMLRMRSGAAR